ncbi:hypothetical protein [Rhizobium sp. CSW-27]|uniref:hypothetical protein n=1 Tax=Rhizobium sp. CSW-27 TaxID=2839985 RepID=UPI001C02B529|nr:hypothetical protein [Rhizobium sp. CSW-27]MBT9373360.1 hypothetical protein [Rhizobium sp. CSW-27]
MRRIVGLDINGWHDFAVHDAKPDSDDEAGTGSSILNIIDGGIGTVVVAMHDPDVRDVSLNFIGGPQAMHSPIGRGNGWGKIGAQKRRISVRSLLEDLLASHDSKERAAQWQATALALTTQADEIVTIIPDRTELDETRQEFLLNALRRRGVSIRLLWHPVATLLTALEQNLIPTPHDGMRIACIDHSDNGYALQILTLRALEEHPGLFAPERAEMGKILRTDPCDFGLQALFTQAEASIHAANPLAEFDRQGPHRMAWELLLADAPPGGEEIVRLDNGSWTSLAPPQPDLHDLQLGLAPLDLADASIVLLTSPVGAGLQERVRQAVATAVGATPVLLMPREAAATGALIAGRRIERGIPHYLDRLEQVSLVALKDGEVVLIDLVPANAVVAANREYVSAPITGLGWPSDARSVTFYLRKGAEFRKWTTADVSPPSSTQAVEVRLRQMPAQGRAAVFVTSNDWDVLRSRPVFLDWSTLEHDPRSFEEIAAELKPKPIVPERVTGFAHVDRWLGTERIPAFGPFISRFELRDAAKLRDFLSRQVPIDVGGIGAGFAPARLLDFDGAPPKETDAELIEALDRALALVASTCLSAVSSRRPLPDNTLLLAATWAFGRCPLDLQDEILKAAHAHLDAREHVFLENRSASTVVLHGLGRIIKEERRLERALDLLLRHHPSKGNVPAAVAGLLSRPIATPAVLTEERVVKTTKFAVALLIELRERQKFGTVLNYALQIVGGILRCREQHPYALLLGISREADAIHKQLASLKPFLERRATGSRQIRAKLGIIDNLMEMLSGSGGDSHILINIESLDTDGDDVAA